MRRMALALAAAAAMLAPATAGAAPPNPFGHACTAQNGTLFCPTASDAQRVPSFDGVPLDVDVTLPPTGDGPFPALVMMHGWSGSKTNFEASSADAGSRYNNLRFAQDGYAVITPSARGFGRSCGAADSRTSPGCDRGWVRLADHRYEIRDVQHLLGLLADQGVIRPRQVGVTGVSYGGIQSLALARLRDRIRLANGAYRRWRSPAGTPMRIAAAFARWPGTDLSSALQPNGRFLDFRPFRLGQSIAPGGVKKESYNNGLYLSGDASGFYAPEAGTPFGANIRLWQGLTNEGEPQSRRQLDVGRELSAFHSVVGLSGTPAPTLIQNGWTDDLFPAPEAIRLLRMFERVRGATVAMQLADIGHSRGQNKEAETLALNEAGARFLAAHVRGLRVSAPAHRSVVAYTQTCPTERPSGGPFTARSWDALHPRSLRLSARRPRTLSSAGANLEVAQAINPIGGGGACARVDAARESGSVYAERRIARPFTLLGLPTVRARIRTTGRGGMIAARLWDVHRGEATLVSRGVLRLRDDQRGRIVFQLFGNGWRFARGHVARLELLGSDPGFLRTSNFDFRVRVSGLRAALPGR